MLRGVAAGTTKLAFAITEPDAGTNSHNLRTELRRAQRLGFDIDIDDAKISLPQIHARVRRTAAEQSADIAAQLQGAGMPALTPAAVIEHGTLPSQRSLVTTLAALPRAAAEHGLGSPAIVVIGEVVNHAQPAALRELASRAA